MTKRHDDVRRHFERQRERRSKYPANLEFQPFSNEFTGDVPLKTPWLPAYHSQRSSLELRAAQRSVTPFLPHESCAMCWRASEPTPPSTWIAIAEQCSG